MRVSRVERVAAALNALGHLVLWLRAPKRAGVADHVHLAFMLAGALLLAVLSSCQSETSYRRHRLYLLPLLRVAAHTLTSQRSATVRFPLVETTASERLSFACVLARAPPAAHSTAGPTSTPLLSAAAAGCRTPTTVSNAVPPPCLRRRHRQASCCATPLRPACGGWRWTRCACC